MNIKNIIINLFMNCALFVSLSAELLILKQTASGFEPLSQADIDKDGDAIAKAILKYQWPMCIISNLSKEEQAELGSSAPGAEEIFIEKKLREISASYRVVFIPTVLYELFYILNFFEQSSIKDSIKNVDKLISMEGAYFKDSELNLSINAYKSAINIKPLLEQLNDIYDWYAIFNNNFFDLAYLNSKKPDSIPVFTITPYMLLNQKIVQFLFDSDNVGQLKKSEKSLDFSNIIENNAIGLFLTKIQNRFNAVNLDKSYQDDDILNQIIYRDTGIIKIKQSLKRMIVLEYEARKLNRGILIRGTSPIEVDLELEELLRDYTNPDCVKTVFTKIKSRIKAIASSLHIGSDLYSISFGNSMFAGIFYDFTACAFHYLSSSPQFGYSVFIDKQKYFTHKLFNLFYISPLSTIAGMLGYGEFFHSRAKVPGANKSLMGAHFCYDIKGLSMPLNNINGIILINQKKLEYEKLFTKYIANNGRIIQMGPGLLPIENSIESQEEEFKKSQMLLAKSAESQRVQTEEFLKKDFPRIVSRLIEKIRNKRIYEGWMSEFYPSEV